MTKTVPPLETTISKELISALLKEFVPVLADEPIEFFSSGWDNEIHRVGSDHAVRMPRRDMAAQLVLNEQRWLAELEPSLPLPVPTPVHNGEPAMGYPWPWSVVRWLPGVPLAHSPALDQERLIADLAKFLNALHVPADAEAPDNPYRGVPLVERDEIVRANIDECAGVDRSALLELWEELIDTPEWGAEPIWLHGDLHPLNMLVRGGRLSGIIDFGDITSGDPATDLAVAWMLFDADGRDAFRSELTIADRTVDVHTWNRSRAWALSVAVAMLAHSADAPTMRRLALGTLNQVL